jgi:predicted O-methyltransferase YrrM
MGLIRDKLHIMNDHYDVPEFVRTATHYAYRRVVKDPSESLRIPFAIKKFESGYSKINPKTREKLLDFAFGFEYFGVSIKPGQNRQEISQLLEVLERDPPRRLLEVGTYLGGTLFLFANVAAKDAHIISLDLPHGVNRMGYPEVRGTLFKRFATGGQKMDLIQIDSHTRPALDAVEKALAGSKLDFLFIDGDHTSEGVRKDFEMYSPLVRKGGIIAFHDITWDHVRDYWHSARKGYRYEELLAGNSPGIGVMFV